MRRFGGFVVDHHTSDRPVNLPVGLLGQEALEVFHLRYLQGHRFFDLAAFTLNRYRCVVSNDQQVDLNGLSFAARQVV